ncbi:MAG TPA: DUF6519 domain-containing protein [Acidobacteriaceae bacterium]|jgi:hypothetical protein|nr:DUF6519 domain-containing protein [Acidobacteriaceae bacterium]
MSFDSSRFTFNPRRNFLGVVMEQGRVQLDSDWNEWQAEFTRRIQAGTLDILGPSAYPINITPNAFAITASSGGSGGNVITIGAGRYYVDGLLAENHGPSASEAWDPALAELSGAPYVQPFSNVTVNYLQQPYLPNAPAITGNGPYLVYLDVWEREVTYLEDEWLIDKAVNVDTTGRMQVIWQVKLLDISSLGSGVTCATDVPSFDTLTAPSAARLTNGVYPNTPSGPCCLAANTGYTGLENQLYRVEIHTGGANPTFKWSRDNASVGTNVTGITTVVVSGTSVSQITVASMGRDSVLGFSNGDWIEITDDDQELAGLAGELHQIMATPAPGLTLTLDSEIALSFSPSDPTRHTRITRWDQKGIVQQVSGSTTTAYFDVDTSGATGIPVPTAAATQVVLENGITVSFSLDPAGGPYYPGDFWTFAARTADGSIQPLSDAPPSGIHHHYARLSVVTFPSTSSDCRVPWPPTITSGGSCCCTVNVRPSDLNANNSLQNIVDQFKNQLTTTEICLAQGTYFLNAPLRLTSAHTNIIIKACQAGTAILQAQQGRESQFYDGMIVLDGVTNITLNGLDFSLPIATFAPTTFAGIAVTALDPDIAAVAQNLAVSIGVRPVNANSVTIENCIFDLTNLGNNLPSENSYPFGAGIFASGDCAGLQVEDNHFEGSGDFQTGFLLAPSVAFTTPTLTYYPGGGFVTDFPTKEGFLTEQQFAAEPAAKPATAAKAAPKPAMVEEKAATEAKAGTNAELQTYKAGSSIINKYQNILNEGTSTPNLAGAGGSVLPALLSQAVFEGNTFSGLTVAVLILGQSEAIDFLSNQVSDCTAGFWMIAPTQTQILLFDEENLTPLGSLIAMSYPLPQGDASTLVTVPPSPDSVFVYPGANDDVDSLGDTWIPDSSTSSTFTLGGTSYVSRPIPPPAITEEGGATEPDPALYQTERYGNSFSYTFNGLPVGYYQVTLKFAEIFWQSAGIRIFDVSINGAQVLTNFDIFADAGGSDIADDQIFPNILPSSGGQIVVQFTGTSNGNDTNAKISAIELDPQWSGNPYLGDSKEGELASFFDQLAQLAQQGYAPLWIVNPTIAREVEIVSPSHLRIQDNEMQGLTAPALLLLGDDSDANENVSSLLMTGNRLNSNISVQDDGFGAGLKGARAGDATLGDLEAEFLDLFFFLFTVTIVQVGQCLVSSNIIGSSEFSLVLYDQAITAPQISVMSNLFNGYMSVDPPAYPASPGVAAPAAVRGLLNTMVT